MSPELTALALAGLLQGVQFVLMAVPANLELGVGTTLGPRDEGPLAERLSPGAGRLARALANHFEALTLFTIAVVVVELSAANTGLTAALAWLYLAARIAYVPCYYFALSPWRSLVWTLGFAASQLMLLAALTHSLFGIAPG